MANKNILSGTNNDDHLIGDQGNNFLYGGLGNDILDGDSGIDTAIFDSYRFDYSIIKTSKSLTVSGANEGENSLTNIERLQFNDVNVALDYNGNAGQAYRIYQAAFDRIPDPYGLSYWINEMDSGNTIKQVATEFINSAEFGDLYGANPTAEDFVTNLYANVLHRAPDSEGFDNWVSHITNGTLSKEEVLIEFSESTENKLNLIDDIGLDVDGTAGQAYRLYQAAFNRQPDMPGLSYWINNLNSGYTLEAVADNFINSQEFIDLYGANPTTADFVTNLYNNVLYRGPDTQGFDHWTDTISNGTLNLAEVLIEFSESDENQINLVGIIGGGIEYIDFTQL